MNCNCPNDGILVEIPAVDCPIDMKQIQKAAFNTAGEVVWDGANGSGTGVTGIPQADSDIGLLADWQARRVAIDASKIVVTPFVGADPIIEAGDSITEGGGDNTTLNGVEDVTGTNPSTFSCMFKSISGGTEKAMKDLMCQNLEVVFFLEGGRIACKKVEGTENHKGFPIQSMFVGDRNNAGFGTKDTNAMSFQLAAGWSEDMVIIEPTDFNPLYDI